MHRLTTALTPQTSRPEAVVRHLNGQVCDDPSACRREHMAPRHRGDRRSYDRQQTGGARRLEVR